MGIAWYFGMLLASHQRQHWPGFVFCTPPAVIHTAGEGRRRGINIANSEPKLLRAYFVLSEITLQKAVCQHLKCWLACVYLEIRFILGTALSNRCIITQIQCQLDLPGVRPYVIDILRIWKHLLFQFALQDNSSFFRYGFSTVVS